MHSFLIIYQSLPTGSTCQKIDPPPVIMPRIDFVKLLTILKWVTRNETQSTMCITHNNMNVDDSSHNRLMEDNYYRFELPL